LLPLCLLLPGSHPPETLPLERSGGCHWMWHPVTQHAQSLLPRVTIEHSQGLRLPWAVTLVSFKPSSRVALGHPLPLLPTAPQARSLTHTPSPGFPKPTRLLCPSSVFLLVPGQFIVVFPLCPVMAELMRHSYKKTRDAIRLETSLEQCLSPLL
jgi:hypothetical protein